MAAQWRTVWAGWQAYSGCRRVSTHVSMSVGSGVLAVASYGEEGAYGCKTVAVFVARPCGKTHPSTNLAGVRHRLDASSATTFIGGQC